MRRLQLRFSLRTLLVLTTVVCVLLGQWVYRAKKQLAIVDSLKQQKYNVAYDTLAWPANLRARVGRYLGPDYAYNVYALLSNDTSGNFHGDLSAVAHLPTLRKLTLDFTAVNDDDLLALRDLPNIDLLMLNYSRVTDAGIAHLTSLPLVSLHLNELALTDTCVEHLKQITTLKWLTLTKDRVSAAALDELRAALPECRIHEEP